MLQKNALKSGLPLRMLRTCNECPIVLTSRVPCRGRRSVVVNVAQLEVAGARAEEQAQFHVLQKIGAEMPLQNPKDIVSPFSIPERTLRRKEGSNRCRGSRANPPF